MSDISPHKLIILAIDDTVQNLTLIDELLSELYVVKVAPGGARGLKIAQGTPKPDLILLDIMMPDLDGFEVCRLLKANPETQLIPVIFLTASTDTEDERKGFELGAVDYIHKPISASILLARVKTHLMLKQVAVFLKD
ncbi:MAG: response regulator [Undibacterium sp.]|nr:response regulator [Undibacterium sp.]